MNRMALFLALTVTVFLAVSCAVRPTNDQLVGAIKSERNLLTLFNVQKVSVTNVVWASYKDNKWFVQMDCKYEYTGVIGDNAAGEVKGLKLVLWKDDFGNWKVKKYE